MFVMLRICRFASLSVALASLLLGMGCSERPLVATEGGGRVAGHVVKGPVAEAEVSIYRLQGDARGALVGTAQTDENGAFEIVVGPSEGPFLVVAAKGQYDDEATGLRLGLDDAELTALIPEFKSGSEALGVVVTPVSHLTAGLALYYVRAEGQGIGAAYSEASGHLNAHFGVLTWATTRPTTLVIEGVTQFDSASRAALVLTALSMQARGIAETVGLTPGTSLNAMTLIGALYEDLTADGVFNGEGAKGVIRLPSPDAPKTYALNGQTVRLSLALAAQRFLGSSLNKSPFKDADTLQFRTDLSSNANPRLFRDEGSSFDSEPPQVVLAGEGPSQYTQQETVTLVVLADDGSGTGVSRVFARSGPGSVPVAGVFTDGRWVFSDLPLRNGANEFAVWAEDNATPANGGSARGAPFELAVQVIRDTAQPSPVFSPVASYVDERSLSLADVVGGPDSPIYRDRAPKETLTEKSEIWKMQTRLSAGESVRAEIFEGDNPKNLPFLHVYSDFDAANEAPIEEVAYTISVSCAGCPAFPDATGLLVPSTRKEERKVFFALPLSSETVPALMQLVSSPATLVIHVYSKDAAGNAASVIQPLTVSFHVIGPPVRVIEEVGYSAVGDRRSAFAYRLSDGSYRQLWNGHHEIVANDNAPPQQGIRMVRYLVENPHAVPVALRSDGLVSGSWSAAERWDHEVFAHAADFSMDGIRFQAKWRHERYPPCGNGTFPWHAPGQSRWFDCVPEPFPAPAAGGLDAIASGGLALSAFSAPQAQGGERTTVPVQEGVSGGPFWMVPAAQGGVPGRIVVYVERPIQGRNYAWGEFGTMYEYAFRVIVGDFYANLKGPFSCTVNGVREQCYESQAHRLARRLVNATEHLSGSVTWRTSAVRGDGRALGDLHVSGTQSFERGAQH